MAEVYESGGAEYGPWGLERLKQIEAEAKYVVYLGLTVWHHTDAPEQVRQARDLGR